jgi:hypothetical protein
MAIFWALLMQRAGKRLAIATVFYPFICVEPVEFFLKTSYRQQVIIDIFPIWRKSNGLTEKKTFPCPHQNSSFP